MMKVRALFLAAFVLLVATLTSATEDFTEAWVKTLAKTVDEGERTDGTDYISYHLTRQLPTLEHETRRVQYFTLTGQQDLMGRFVPSFVALVTEGWSEGDESSNVTQDIVLLTMRGYIRERFAKKMSFDKNGFMRASEDLELPSLEQTEAQLREALTAFGE